MMAAAGCRQDVWVHKHVCVFLCVRLPFRVCVCVPECWWLVLVNKCYFAGVLCMFMSMCVRVCVCVFVCTAETIIQSQCVTLGLVPQRSPFALASVYLWTKGCFETNDLAPVSQSRRTRDEKERGQRWGRGKWCRLSDKCVESRRVRKGNRRGRSSSRVKESVGLKENLWFSFGSSHSSSSCEQFSPGNDSLYFCRLVCLTPAHRNCAWPSGTDLPS